MSEVAVENGLFILNNKDSRRDCKVLLRDNIKQGSTALNFVVLDMMNPFELD